MVFAVMLVAKKVQQDLLLVSHQAWRDLKCAQLITIWLLWISYFCFFSVVWLTWEFHFVRLHFLWYKDIFTQLVWKFSEFRHNAWFWWYHLILLPRVNSQITRVLTQIAGWGSQKTCEPAGRAAWLCVWRVPGCENTSEVDRKRNERAGENRAGSETTG